MHEAHAIMQLLMYRIVYAMRLKLALFTTYDDHRLISTSILWDFSDFN